MEKMDIQSRVSLMNLHYGIDEQNFSQIVIVVEDKHLENPPF